MKPDYDRAATAAMEILVKNQISDTPIIPLPILKKHPGVRVIQFARMANEAGVQRENLIQLFDTNLDAATFHLNIEMEGIKYVVVYNAQLSFKIIWRAIARELGHIVLGHDGTTRPEDIRRSEAMCFAHHLLSPRPILRMLQNANVLTMNALADTTGCIDECVYDMQQIPGAHVDPALNRQVRDLFARGIDEYIKFHSKGLDRSPALDMGTFMDGYEE